MRLTRECPICSKNLVLTSSTKLSQTEVLKTFKCGHCFIETIDTPLDRDKIIFKSVYGNKTARDYQKDGIEFILNSNFCCTLADQMRLGKTPQALLALRNKYSERLKVLITVRSANEAQWIREYKEWVDPLPLGIYPIHGSKGWIPPGFHTYIISMDTLGRKGMLDKLKEMKFDLIIADEAHSFKNGDSQRSQAITDLVKHLNMVDYSDETDSNGNRKQSLTTKKNCGIVLLTGTPIKNRADEMFVPLNLTNPEGVPSLEHYRRRWLCQDSKGKWSRVNPYVIDEFKEFISPVFLRREKEDVYTDLPPLNRMYTVITIEDEALKKAYNKILDKIDQDLSEGHATYWEQQDNLMMLRQICGLAKVDWLADYLEVSLDENPTRKFAVGIHHHSVRDLLQLKLKKYGVKTLSGQDSAENKDHIMTSFEKSWERILVVNMLAGGVGMDFHYLNDILILERQWSSADEEQFEFRFYNPDRSIKNVSTDVEYVLAKGTIDEYFHDMIENKRQICGETIGTQWDLTTDPVMFKELIERTVSGRL